MRKIYSLVLMATMLLMGTNAWAETLTVGTGGTYSNIAAAVNAANSGDLIQVVSPVSTDANPIWINKNLTLDLQGYTYTYTGTNAIAIGITSGSLTIQGTGTLKATAIGDDLIRIYGTYNKIDAKNAAPYSQLVVANGVTLQSNKNAISIDVMRKGQAAKFGKSDSDVPYSLNFFHKAGSGYGVANGVKVEIAGKINAAKYGVKCNGTVRDGKEFADKAANWYTYEYPSQDAYEAAATDNQYSPYIIVTSTGRIVTTDKSSNKAVAVYASGYARWLIEGYCEGSTGVYVKSGDVDINNAVVTSNYSGTFDPVDGVSNASGVTGAGSALAIESNANYSGNMDVTVSGNSELTSECGYAIEEKVSGITEGNGDSKLEAVTITGGTFSGEEGTITISETTASGTTEITITGGTVEGSATIGTENLADFLAGADAHYTTVNDENGDPVIIIAPGSAPTTVEANFNILGLATFSATETVTIPDGMKAYKTEGLSGDVLDLVEVTGKIPAGSGVILYKVGATTEYLPVYTGTDPVSMLENNILKPSTAWHANLENVYILHDSELWLYTGTQFKANKAFLQLTLPATTPAPKRLRMIFNQTETPTAVENVETQNVKAVKFVGEDGQLYIRRGEAVYTVQGQVVK